MRATRYLFKSWIDVLLDVQVLGPEDNVHSRRAQCLIRHRCGKVRGQRPPGCRLPRVLINLKDSALLLRLEMATHVCHDGTRIHCLFSHVTPSEQNHAVSHSLLHASFSNAESLVMCLGFGRCPMTTPPKLLCRSVPKTGMDLRLTRWLYLVNIVALTD